jgi:hypothetical protein
MPARSFFLGDLSPLMVILSAISLQDYFGAILRYYFVVGAEIVPQRAFVTETKHLLEYYFL